MIKLIEVVNNMYINAGVESTVTAIMSVSYPQK